MRMKPGRPSGAGALRTPIKIALPSGAFKIVGEGDEAFEADDETAAELLAQGAAEEADAPAPKPASKAKK